VSSRASQLMLIAIAGGGVSAAVVDGASASAVAPSSEAGPAPAAQASSSTTSTTPPAPTAGPATASSPAADVASPGPGSSPETAPPASAPAPAPVGAPSAAAVPPPSDPSSTPGGSTPAPSSTTPPAPIPGRPGAASAPAGGRPARRAGALIGALARTAHHKAKGRRTKHRRRPARAPSPSPPGGGETPTTAAAPAMPPASSPGATPVAAPLAPPTPSGQSAAPRRPIPTSPSATPTTPTPGRPQRRPESEYAAPARRAGARLGAAAHPRRPSAKVKGPGKHPSHPGGPPSPGHLGGGGRATSPTLPTTAAPVISGTAPPSPAALAALSANIDLLSATASTAALQYLRIPLFLLPIYQAAASHYGVPWQVLAAINEVETDYGRDLSISTAGAQGWMQFIPETWRQYGVDAIASGAMDPYNAADAIYAAARYLHAAGAQTNLRGAIYAYNHSDAYVSSVLLRAKLIAGFPAATIATLTGLVEGVVPLAPGIAFTSEPVTSTTSPATHSSRTGPAGPTPVAVSLVTRHPAAVVVAHGGRVIDLGESPQLGRFLKLRDADGNLYTYANLTGLVARYPAPEHPLRPVAHAALALARAPHDGPPGRPASAGMHPAVVPALIPRPAPRVVRPSTYPDMLVTKERLYAHPQRPDNVRLLGNRAPGSQAVNLDPGSAAPGSHWRLLRRGATLTAGTVIGHIAARPGQMARLRFTVRPAGDHSSVDPRPILDSWRLLDATVLPPVRRGPSALGAGQAAGAAVASASGVTASPAANAGASPASVASSLSAPGSKPTSGPSFDRAPATAPEARSELGSLIFGAGASAVFTETRQQLQAQVLTDWRIQIYSCGRDDIAHGLIDRRVLAVLEYLAQNGLHPTVSALRCGHSIYTTAGNVSEHSSGDAVDIAAVNGIPILGHQGPGSIADVTIRRLLTLTGLFVPHQIISLMTYPGASNTLSLPDHANHIHVGFSASGQAVASSVTPGPPSPSQTASAAVNGGSLDSHGWNALLGRVEASGDPGLAAYPSPAAIPDPPRRP